MCVWSYRSRQSRDPRWWRRPAACLRARPSLWSSRHLWWSAPSPYCLTWTHEDNRKQLWDSKTPKQTQPVNVQKQRNTASLWPTWDTTLKNSGNPEQSEIRCLVPQLIHESTFYCYILTAVTGLTQTELHVQFQQLIVNPLTSTKGWGEAN